VRAQRREDGRVVVVAHAELHACLFHDGRDRGVIDVAYAREEMMLDLKVQTAEQPRGQMIVARKVDGRFHLMHSPRFGDSARSIERELGSFDTVRELKDDAQHDADHGGRECVYRGHDPERMKGER
jgi:hypothetical protein